MQADRPVPRAGRFLFRSSHSIIVQLVAMALCLMGSSNALAQSHEVIHFDFTPDTSFSLLGGTIVTPPDGTLDLGAGRISVEATAPGVLIPGGVFIFDSLEIAGTVSKDVFGAAQIDGDYAASQSAPLVGTLAPAMNGGNFSADLALNVNIVLGCVGSGCSSLGFPISDIGLSLLSVSFLSVTDLAVSGNARITANFPIEVDGVLGTLDLIGVEVSRSFVVPEPGTFILVAAGLLGLAAQRRPARRLCGRATSMCKGS